jgi:hypothetical protein
MHPEHLVAGPMLAKLAAAAEPQKGIESRFLAILVPGWGEFCHCASPSGPREGLEIDLEDR